MYTYIIESQGLHKIGKTGNLEKRYKGIETNNPIFQVVREIEGDIEKLLHNTMKEKHVKLEWYKLNEEDIKLIDTIIESHKSTYIGTPNKEQKKKGLNTAVDIKILSCIQKMAERDPDRKVMLNKKAKKKIQEETEYAMSSIERSIRVLTKGGYMEKDTRSERSSIYQIKREKG